MLLYKYIEICIFAVFKDEVKIMGSLFEID